jgi:hypothetical protein
MTSLVFSSLSSSKTSIYKLLTILLMTISASKSETANSGNGTTDDLELMFQRMETDVLRFARHMENLTLPDNKCVSRVLEDCAIANYDGCVSTLPSPKCPGGSEFASDACGDGTKCGAVYDFSTTTLRMAPGSYNTGNLEPNSDNVSPPS